MKKQISNIGKMLTRTEQRYINGGNGADTSYDDETSIVSRNLDIQGLPFANPNDSSTSVFYRPDLENPR